MEKQENEEREFLEMGKPYEIKLYYEGVEICSIDIEEVLKIHRDWEDYDEEPEKGKHYDYAYSNKAKKKLNEYLRYMKTLPDITADKLLHGEMAPLDLTRDVNVHYPEFENFPLLNVIRDYVAENFDKVDAMTGLEAMKNENTELRLRLLQNLGAEAVFESLDLKSIDKQVIRKTRKKTVLRTGKNEHDKKNLLNLKPDDLMEVDEEYDDVYELYMGEVDEVDIYLLKCIDPSTQNTYYLYPRVTLVPEAKKDAIAAVASLMNDKDGKPLSKARYLQDMVSET